MDRLIYLRNITSSSLLLISVLVISCIDKDKPSVTSFIEQAGVDFEQQKGSFGDTLYVLQTPIWESNPGFPLVDKPFSKPKDVYVGREPFIYVADTGNDRIFMLDTFGNIIEGGVIEGIPHPVDMVQDPRLRLYIVNETSMIFVIDLFKYNHDLAIAKIDTIFGAEQKDHDCELSPTDCWDFVGVSVYKNSKGEDELYLASTGPREKNRMIHQVSLDTSRAEPYKGPLPLVAGGLGFFGVTGPTGITDVPGRLIDFIYTQKGANSFKVQWITSGGETSPFDAFLDPRLGFDIFRTEFVEPEDVAVDEFLNVYVIDAAADSMYKYSSNGALLQTLGPINDAQKELTLTSTILENIYIDSLDGSPLLQNSIEIFKSSNSDTTLLLSDNGRGFFEGWAGTGTINYETGLMNITFNDSMRSVTSAGVNMNIFYSIKGLNNPHGISVFDKIVYIADTGNDRVLRYKLSTDIE